MLPAPMWPLAEHASLGQNCFDASIGSVWFCILDSMPVDACFCKSSFSFHRLVELYPTVEECVGIAVSKYFEWDTRIFIAFYEALTDANFHTEAAEVETLAEN